LSTERTQQTSSKLNGRHQTTYVNRYIDT